MERKYLVGVVLVAISAVIWSSAGIFARGVAADAWAVIFWRGVAAAGFTIVYLMMRGVLAKEEAAVHGSIAVDQCVGGIWNSGVYSCV